MAAGIAGFWATLQYAGIDVTPWQLVPALTVTGLGMGMLMAPFFDTVLAGVEPEETGSAGGTLTAVQQLGLALGAAVLGTIFFGLLGGHVAGEHSAEAGFSDAMKITLWVEVGLLALTFLLTFLLPRHPRPEDEHA